MSRVNIWRLCRVPKIFRLFQDVYQTFSGLFLDVTFPIDLPRSNTGTLTFNTIWVKLSILNKILWKCMSKDQTWKIIFFFHTNRPQNFFPYFSRMENDQIFSMLFQTPEEFRLCHPQTQFPSELRYAQYCVTTFCGVAAAVCSDYGYRWGGFKCPVTSTRNVTSYNHSGDWSSNSGSPFCFVNCPIFFSQNNETLQHGTYHGLITLPLSGGVSERLRLYRWECYPTVGGPQVTSNSDETNSSDKHFYDVIHCWGLVTQCLLVQRTGKCPNTTSHICIVSAFPLNLTTTAVFPQPLTEKHLRLRGPIGPRLLRPFPAFMHLFSFIFPHLFSFQHLFSFIFSTAFPLGRRARNASRSTAISDSSAGPTPKRGQARSEMQSRHLVLGRTLGRFPVGLASRTCLANLSWDVSRAPTTELTTYMIWCSVYHRHQAQVILVGRILFTNEVSRVVHSLRRQAKMKKQNVWFCALVDSLSLQIKIWNEILSATVFLVRLWRNLPLFRA